MDHVAFPVGGIGTGMICFEGTGAISHVSLHHVPDLFHEPCTFAAVCVKGVENGAKVLEANVPEYKKYGRLNGGMGVGGTTWGLPRFDEGRFSQGSPLPGSICMTTISRLTFRSSPGILLFRTMRTIPDFPSEGLNILSAIPRKNG